MDYKAENELIIKAKKHDLKAFETLFKTYYGRIYKYLVFKVGSKEEAQDLCQQVFLGAFQNIGSFYFMGRNFSSWLFKIAYNKSMSYFRKNYQNKKNFKSYKQIFLVDKECSEEIIVDGETILQLRKAIESLRENQKKVIEFRFLGQLSILETAKAMGKSIGAVKLLQYRALRNLRGLLK